MATKKQAKAKTAKNKETRGRPTVMTEVVLNLLRHAYGYGASDIEACQYAGIGKTALYEYLKEHQDFAEEREGLQTKTNLLARKAVNEELTNPMNVKRGSLGLDYLKAKLPQEFAPRNTLDLGVSEELKESMQKTKEMFDEVFANKLKKGAPKK